MQIREFETLEDMQTAHRADNEHLPCHYAFTQGQIQSLMSELKLTDRNDLIDCGDGITFCTKEEYDEYRKITNRQEKEKELFENKFSKQVDKIKKAMKKTKYIIKDRHDAKPRREQILKVLAELGKHVVDLNRNYTFNQAFYKAETEYAKTKGGEK